MLQGYCVSRLNCVSHYFCCLLLMFSTQLVFAVPLSEPEPMALQVAKQRSIVAGQWFKIAEEKLQQAEQWLQRPSLDKSIPNLAELKLRQSAVSTELEEIKITQLESLQLQQTVQNTLKRLSAALQTATYAHEDAARSQAEVLRLQKRIQFQQRLLAAEKLRYERLLQAAATLKNYHLKLNWLVARAIQAVVQAEREQLQKNYRQQQIKLQQAQQTWLQQLADKQAALQAIKDDASLPDGQLWTQAHWQSQWFMEKANSYQLKQSLLDARYQQQRLAATQFRSSTVSELNAYEADIQSQITRVEKLDHLLQRKRKLVSDRLNLIQAQLAQKNLPQTAMTTLKKQFLTLGEEYHALQKRNAQVLGALAEHRAEVQQHYATLRHERSVLSLLKWETWQQIFHALWVLPILLLKALSGLRQQVTLALQQMPWYEILSVWLGALLWWPLARIFKYLLNVVTRSQAEVASSRDAWRVLFELLRRNLNLIVIFLAIMSFLFLSTVPFISYSVFCYIALAWLGTRVAINLARILLLETEAVSSGEDVRLYHELKWLFLTGAAFVTISILTHSLPAGLDLRLLANRMVMIYLLALGFILFRGRFAVQTLLEPHLENRALYVRRVINILVVLVPLLIISNALLGLFGYMGLTTAISRNEGMLLLVMTAYILLRGLLIDVTGWLSNIMIRQLRNGWLWSEALLKPLDKLLRLALFLVAIYSLLILYDWGPGTHVYAQLQAISVYPLFYIGDSPFTLRSVLGVIIAVSILVWLGRWVRECAYRWLYAKYRDLGIRNSLAAFTQYTTVIIGAYIALRVLGIDISGLRFILGGLAVGAGFGLRDVANNLISGVLLLMERPLKRGDLVSIGGFEGEVTHIGLRSITVLSWDNMEVLVPNSETFSKAFTNWTRQDSVVRTVISVKIQRLDDPVKVQQLLLDVLQNCESVVSEPEPQVFLKEISESLIEFEVRYYINLQLSRSRPIVRSEVLFAIWQCFDEHGIKPPYPQQGLHMQLDQADDKPIAIQLEKGL